MDEGQARSIRRVEVRVHVDACRPARYVSSMKLAVVLACCLFAGACSKGPSCERTYELLKECSGRGFDTDRQSFLARCEAEKASPDLQPIIECSGATSCDAFHQCTDQASQEAVASHRKNRLAEDTGRLATELGARKYRQARWTCEAIGEALAGEHAPEEAVCAALPSRAVDALTGELTGLRDRGVADVSGSCAVLVDFSRAVSTQAVARATTLCEEVRASAHAAETLAEVQQLLTDKALTLPLGCSLVLGELAKIDSEFARRRAAEVAQACYADLGKPILTARVATAKGACDFEVRLIVDAFDRWAPKDAALATLVAKARPLCATTPPADRPR